MKVTLILAVTVLPFSLAAWEGKVFQVNGRKVTIASTNTAGLKPGRQLYVMRGKQILGHGRIDAFYHTKVEMTLRSGEATKGLVVKDSRPQEEKDSRTLNILRDPRSGYEIAFPSDWKTFSPEPDNTSLVQLLSADEKASIVINPFDRFGENTAGDYLQMYAKRSGLGDPLRFGEMNEEAQNFGAESGHEGIYFWNQKPTIVSVYLTASKAYLIQYRYFNRGHNNFSQKTEDDAFRVLHSFRIGKIKTKSESESAGEGKIISP